MLSDHAILNPRLLAALASAGHTDVVVIADAGLPVPGGVTVVDLSLVPGVPSFRQTVEAVRGSLVVEAAVVAEEAAEHGVAQELAHVLGGIPLETVGHDELKRLTRTAHVVIRTGECTPYANVALIAGVTF